MNYKKILDIFFSENETREKLTSTFVTGSWASTIASIICKCNLFAVSINSAFYYHLVNVSLPLRSKINSTHRSRNLGVRPHLCCCRVIRLPDEEEGRSAGCGLFEFYKYFLSRRSRIVLSNFFRLTMSEHTKMRSAAHPWFQWKTNRWREVRPSNRRRYIHVEHGVLQERVITVASWKTHIWHIRTTNSTNYEKYILSAPQHVACLTRSETTKNKTNILTDWLCTRSGAGVLIATSMVTQQCNCVPKMTTVLYTRRASKLRDCLGQIFAIRTNNLHFARCLVCLSRERACRWKRLHYSSSALWSGPRWKMIRIEK